MEGIKIVTIEAILQFGDLQIVQSFELHIGIGEGFSQLWLILRQQVECGLV